MDWQSIAVSFGLGSFTQLLQLLESKRLLSPRRVLARAMIAGLGASALVAALSEYIDMSQGTIYLYSIGMGWAGQSAMDLVATIVRGRFKLIINEEAEGNGNRDD